MTRKSPDPFQDFSVRFILSALRWLPRAHNHDAVHHFYKYHELIQICQISLWLSWRVSLLPLTAFDEELITIFDIWTTAATFVVACDRFLFFFCYQAQQNVVSVVQTFNLTDSFMRTSLSELFKESRVLLNWTILRSNMIINNSLILMAFFPPLCVCVCRTFFTMLDVGPSPLRITLSIWISVRAGVVAAQSQSNWSSIKTHNKNIEIKYFSSVLSDRFDGSEALKNLIFGWKDLFGGWVGMSCEVCGWREEVSFFDLPNTNRHSNNFTKFIIQYRGNKSNLKIVNNFLNFYDSFIACFPLNIYEN